MCATSVRTVARPTSVLVSGVALCVLLAASRPAPAAGEPVADAPAATTWQLKIGVQERVRSENWDNSSDFDAAHTDARHQLRFRTRAWLDLARGTRFAFVLGLDNESRRITTPETPFEWDETIFETLYLDAKITPAVAVRVGRQNLQRNDGFLLLEGGPLDGSRSTYSNALDVTYTRGASKLECLAITNPSRDQYLPPFNDQDKLLVEWDELALGLWYVDTHVESTTLEGYYFWKGETDDVRAPTASGYQPDRNVHTLGTRILRKWLPDWSLTAELAGQLGQSDPDAGLRAWGSQASAKKTFAHTTKPSLTLGWAGLSGDDPASAAIEAWDPLFARWPKWSELYIYTLASETGVAYWTNLAMGQVRFQITPWKHVDLHAVYSRLGAFHPFPGPESMYGAGRRRGDLFELHADIAASSPIRGHLLGEYLAPGSFYAGSAGAWFLRAEISASFEHLFVF